MDAEQEKLSMAFKQTFAGPHAEVVLDHLNKICFAYPQAPLFDDESQRMTDFNLGMNWVYGYIINQIDSKIDETDDCQTEEPKQKGI